MTDAAATNLDEIILSFMHWHGIATFLRTPYRPDFADTDIGLIGVPSSSGNPVGRMQHLGPRAVRNRSAGSHKMIRSLEIDPFALVRVSDLGDVPLPRILHPDMTADDIEAFYARVFAAGVTPVSVGGDHSITPPILRARHKHVGAPVGLIHFDSHTDAYTPSAATRNTAGGFRTAAEDGIIDPKRTVQIGIRGPVPSLEMDAWAYENFGRVITTDEFVEIGETRVIEEIRRVIGDGPAYLTFDLDVLDPAYAPGVAVPELNGLTTREIFRVVNGLRGLNLVGADIVCFCPPLDNAAETTAIAASELLLTFTGLIADRLATAGRG